MVRARAGTDAIAWALLGHGRNLRTLAHVFAESFCNPFAKQRDNDPWVIFR
jgi:hypothetical protein